MSDCGCGSCGSCGNTPKMNGTEVTILSGTQRTRQNGGDSKSDLYMVLGATAVIAVVAVLMAKK